jgi:hypothetical protein
MHSTTLTAPVRQLYVERSWPELDKRAMAQIIERNAKEQLSKILAPKRKSEVRCPECNMILSKQASSCFC